MSHHPLAVELRAMQPSDWPEVAEIYAEGIATGDATFERSVPSYTDWDRAHLTNCRLVAEHNACVIGWAALSPVSSRCVYGGVGEVSVYVAASARGQDIGKRLLHALIRAAEHAGLWMLQAGIFPENTASIAVHTRCGFRTVGIREKIGQLQGVWRDSLLLEYRSTTIGVETSQSPELRN